MASNILFKQQCPSCEAMVSIKESALIGKKTDCPKCKYRFLVQDPKGADGSSDEPKAAAKPAKKANAAGESKSTGIKTKPTAKPRIDEPEDEKGKPETKSAKSANKMILGLGLAGVAVVVLAVAGFFILGNDDSNPTRKNSRGGPKVNPANSGIKEKDPATTVAPSELAEASNYLPAEAEVVVNIPVRDFFNSQIGKVAHEAGLRPEILDKMLGCSLEDIDRVLLALNLTEHWGFAVIRTNKPLKLETIKSSLGLKAAEAPIQGQDYYLTEVNWLSGDNPLFASRTPDQKPNTARPMAVRLQDSQTVVFADLVPMKQFLDVKGRLKPQARKGQPTPTDADLAKKPYLTVNPRLRALLDVIETRKPILLSVAANTAVTGDSLGKLLAFSGVQLEMNAVGVALTGDGDLGAALAIECKNEDFAIDISKDFKQRLEPFAKKLSTSLKLQVKWLNPKAKPRKSGTGDEPKKETPDGQEESFGSVTIEMPSIDEKIVRTNLTLDRAGFSNLYARYGAPSVLRRRGEVEMATIRPSPHDLAAAGRNYGSKNQKYPRGTFERPIPASRAGRPWAPDQRVSWLVDLLPYLGAAELHQQVSASKSWRDVENLPAAMTLVPYYLDPDSPKNSWYAPYRGLTNEVAATHYVGIAGVGLDAADYPKDDPDVRSKLGILGYDRVTPLAEVSDPAHTILMIQIPTAYRGPWIAGGGSTVRGVPETKSVQPFVAGSYKQKLGTYAVMADGSVRFIAADVSDEVFKALCTVVKGQPPKDGLDGSPIVPPTKNELKTDPPR